MKRTIRTLLLWVLLTACTASTSAGHQEESGRTGAIFLPRTEAPARQSLVFLVDSGQDPLFVSAAELFAEKAFFYSGELLTVEVVPTDTPEEDYRSGKGELLLHDGRDSIFGKEIQLLSTPFLYGEYSSMTMALNSTRMLEALNEKLVATKNTYALGAFYTGSDFLMIPRRRTGEAAGDDEDERDSITAATRGQSDLAAYLERIGVNSQPVEELAVRYQQVADSQVDFAEIALDEVRVLTWRDSGITLLHMHHNLSPQWLLIRSDYYDALPANYQAVLQESMAYLFPFIDDWYDAQVQDTLSFVREQGGSVERSYQPLRQRAEAALRTQTEGDYPARYVLDIIDSLE